MTKAIHYILEHREEASAALAKWILAATISLCAFGTAWFFASNH